MGARERLRVKLRVRVTFMSIENSYAVMKPQPEWSMAFHTPSTC